MTKKTNIWKSISAVLSGNYTEEEWRITNVWIGEDEKNRRFFERLQQASFRKDIEREANAVQERIFQLTLEKISRRRLIKKLHLWQSLAVVAMFCLLISLGVNYIRQTAASAVPDVFVESKSPIGSISNLTLSDGTMVVLNAGSAISYPQTFKGDTRTVRLTGEAYFDVAEDTEHPFIVETENMKITVLGTCFDVKAYNEDRMAMVTTQEGLVKVNLMQPGSSSRPVHLRENQQVLYNKHEKEMQLQNVNATYYTAWKNGTCFFDNERMEDIAKILSRQYGVKIKILSLNIANQQYSGFFNKDEGLFHILNSFKKNRNLEYKQTENEIIIYEK